MLAFRASWLIFCCNVPFSSNPEWDEQTLGPNSLIHVRGQLLQLNIDGSQVVELTKTPTKPYGFFVARGRVRNSKGKRNQ